MFFMQDAGVDSEFGEFAAKFKAHAEKNAADGAQKSEQDVLHRLESVRGSVYDWFKETGKHIPDWLPIIKPLFDTAAHQMRSSAALSGIDLDTKLPLNTLKERLSVFAKSEFQLLFAKGRLALDLLLLLGTGGSGSAVEAGAIAGGKAAVKAGAAEVGEVALKDKLLGFIKLLSTSKEGAAIDLSVEGLKALTTRLSHKPELAKALGEITKLFETFGKNEMTRGQIIAWLKEQPWWQELLKEISTTEGQIKHRDEIWKAKQQSGFSFKPQPA